MPELTTPKIDASDPGKAAVVAAAAAILYARCSGYNAENQIRDSQGLALAYDSAVFEYEVEDFFKRLEQ